MNSSDNIFPMTLAVSTAFTRFSGIQHPLETPRVFGKPWAVSKSQWGIGQLSKTIHQRVPSRWTLHSNTKYSDIWLFYRFTTSFIFNNSFINIHTSLLSCKKYRNKHPSMEHILPINNYRRFGPHQQLLQSNNTNQKINNLVLPIITEINTKPRKLN